MSTVTYQPGTSSTPQRVSALAARSLPVSANAAQRLAAVYRLILDRAAEADAQQAAGYEPSATAHPLNDVSSRHADGARDLVLPAASPT
jgi:hypothetical protein